MPCGVPSCRMSRLSPVRGDGSRRYPGPANLGSRMRILYAATSYPSSSEDWKGLFILRLLESLDARPDLEVSTWLPSGNLPAGTRSACLEDDATWLAAILAEGGMAHALRTRPLKGIAYAWSLLRRLRRAMRQSDAGQFHLNWLQLGLALPRDGRPALISVLGTDMRLLGLPGMRWCLRRAFSGHKVTICPNAEWMEPILLRAFGDLAKVQYVPFGIDRGWFEITRPESLPRPLRWLCVSRLTRAKLGPLFEWAEAHFRNRTDRTLHLIGPRQENNLHIPEWVHVHEPVTPAELQRTWFPESTGLISLSRHDEGRPQVMLEAMASSLPILASRIPAHEDIVRPGQTGWLCGDPDEFAQGLSLIEDAKTNVRLGRESRARAEYLYGDWQACAERYASHYQYNCQSGRQ